MKIVIQVVKHASVSVDNKLVNEIKNGYLLLVGIEPTDNEEVVAKFAKKVVNMRINKDEFDKTNLSILDIHGEILSISQFTLCADVKKSRRPSFTTAASPILANDLYNKFNNELRNYGIVVKDGVFGAEMEVSLLNFGPFTIVLNNENL